MDAALCLLLIIIANGAPIVARQIFRGRWSKAVDGARRWRDGRPLLGASKTWRGIAAALFLTSLAALLLDLPVHIGLLIAIGSMLGDLLASLLKRRLDLPPSAMALGLDQIPESLLPLLAVHRWFGFGAAEIALLVASFVVIELILSRILFRLHVRQRPY